MKFTMNAPMEVGISCRDLTKMRNFYEETLGFEFISEIEGDATAAHQLGLCAEGYTVARVQTPYGERIKLLMPDSPPAEEKSSQYFLDKMNRAYLTFIVKELDSVVDRIRGLLADKSLITPIKDVRSGVRAAFCKDPEGNYVELVEFEDVASYRKDIYGRS